MSTLFQWLIDVFRDAKFWFKVEPWEKAVRVRAGKHSVVIGPGIHLKIPLIDEAYIVNTRLRLCPTTAQVISTQDGKVVTTGVQIGFSIHDPLQALSAYLHPENSIAVLVHNYVADYILSKSSTEISTAELEESVVAGLKDSDPSNGITVEFVKVTDLVISSAARTIRLVQDEVIRDYSSEARDRSIYQTNVTQW